MDLGITKRCESCYALVTDWQGELHCSPVNGVIIDCTRGQFDTNICPACEKQNLMVVY